ncbi:MAG TPA: iron ABC transporter permease [Pseudomonadales bacterium]|jgi:iron complex transport system permease protein|nr:iron ABC transporter permease [Cellvibrionales bacterium]HRG49826.1 iron ABC transporter permease [Pseudomonadales bacterium]
MKLLHTSPATLNLLLISATLLCFLLSLCTGSADVSVGKGVADALHHATSMESLIVMELRLPRALLALFIGGTLGMAGAALQGMLRNPLAEPGIIGVSNGAALGAVVMFYFGFASLGWFLLPLGGLLGACVAVLCLVLLVPHNSNVLTLILAGIAINAIGSALIALALNFAPSPYAMQEIVYWLLGSVTNRSLHDVAIALPFMATGWLMMLRCGSFLDALTLGEDTAQSLGFNVRRLRWILVGGVAAGIGAAVSVSGNIGFVGLVVPHVLRPLVGYSPKRLLGVSFWGGAILLLLADITVQLLSHGGEMKLGVVTALVGGPFFLYLILRTRSYWS